MQGYQRLEFLGDAVLDLLMTRYFFITYRFVQCLPVDFIILLFDEYT